MITLKGAEVSAKIKEQVLAMNGKLGGYVPTAAIVRIGERPDDLSYERNVMKRIAAYGMETMSYVYPADITEEEFFAEFQKINDDEAIDGILLFRPLPKYINEKRAEQMIRPEKDLDGICAVNTAKVFAGEKDGFAPCTAEAVIEVLMFTTCTGSLSKRNMADISGMKKVTESNASSPFSRGLAGSPFMDKVPSISPFSSTIRSGTNGLTTFSGKCSKAISALRLPVPSAAGR